MATTTELIQQLYVAYYNRPADVSGLAFWVDAYDNRGASLDAISKSFNTAPEYVSNYAGRSADQIVNIVYQNLFGRTADSEGLNFWGPKIASGAITTADLVKSISAGAINADGTANSDGLILANKVAAAGAFTTELSAAGNEAERIAYSSGSPTVVAAAKAYIAGVTDDASLATATANVHATAQNMVVLTTPSVTYTLTTGIDTGAAFVGGAGNDVFDATKGATGAATLNALDVIDGGAGSDTLNVAQTAAVNLTASTIVTNVESANVVSGSTVALNAAAWTGLTNLVVASAGGETVTAIGTAAVTTTDTALAAGTIVVNGGTSVNVTASGSTTGTISVGATTAATGAVTVNNTTAGAVAAGAITVNGGTTINVKQTASNAVNTDQTNGAVTITGSTATTGVVVAASTVATKSATVAGVIANTVSIADVNAGSATKAGTITSISVDGYTTLGIADTALTSLSIAHGSGNIIIDNSGLNTATNKTLALAINGVTGGTLDDADIYTTLNVTTSGANSTLANITDSALTTLSVAGAKGLTLTSTAGLSKLATVTVSGAAGLTADLTTPGTVSSVNAAATSGANKVTINAAQASYTGGSGVDTVTLATGNVTKAINLGAGDDSLVLGTLTTTVAINGGTGTDTLSIGAAAAATASGDATFAGLVTGFEHLTLTGATNQTIDLAVLGNYNYVTTSGGNGLTLSNLNSGGTLALTGAGTAYTVGNSAFAAGTNDVLNVALTDGSGAAVSFAATGITAANVETVAITVADTQATPTGSFNDLVTLLGNSYKTITVAGNAGLTLTATSTGLTSVDASGIAGTDITPGFTFTSGALAAAATIKGSATGTNTINFSAATGGAVTYTGGSGDDAITASNGKANIITLGNGTNSVTATSGNNTITGGTGADTVTVTTGNNIVNLGNGANAFTATTGNNTYVGGTGVDTVTVGGGANSITLGTGADVVNLTASGANVNTYSTIVDAHTGVQLAFANLGTETFATAKVSSLDPGTAVFQDYANAVVAGATQADHSVNGAFGWFQFGGNTYLVEVRHDTTAGVAQTFSNGTDMIVKLTGLVDLSTATGAGTNVLTLA